MSEILKWYLKILVALYRVSSFNDVYTSYIRSVVFPYQYLHKYTGTSLHLSKLGFLSL